MTAAPRLDSPGTLPEMTRRVLVLGSCLCFCLAVATYVVAFKTADGRRFDAETYGAPGGPSSIEGIRTAVDAIVHMVGIGSGLLLASALFVSAFVRRRGDLVLAVVFLFAVATATAEVLKPLLRAWDVFGGDAARESHGYFPSGHATVAMAGALAFVLAAPQAWKLFAASIGGAYAAAVGVALIVQGSHYTSDVVGGFLLTGAWCCVVAALVQRRSGSRAAAAGRAVSTLAGLALTAALVAAVALAASSEMVRHVELHPSFAVATLGISALALVLTFALAIGSGRRAPDGAATAR
jgi:membrane-associated phospholipid phosphatase